MVAVGQVLVSGGALTVLAVSVRCAVHAHARRNALPYRGERGDDFASSEARGGARRVDLGPDPAVVARVRAELTEAGVPHQIVSGDRGGGGEALATNTLIHQAADGRLVAEVLRPLSD